MSNITHKMITRTIWSAIIGLGILTTLSSVGCDTPGMGGVWYDDYSDIFQSSYEYQQDVFDSANDAWTDYIRM